MSNPSRKYENFERSKMRFIKDDYGNLLKAEWNNVEADAHFEPQTVKPKYCATPYAATKLWPTSYFREWMAVQ